MESALQVVLQQASEHHARRVDRVVLRIGALAGVEAQALHFAFDAIAHGTIAEGATLDIDAVRTVVFCAGCEREFEPEGGSFIFQCPACGALCGEVRQGRELELSRIEME